jgi:hypothetical protein
MTIQTETSFFKPDTCSNRDTTSFFKSDKSKKVSSNSSSSNSNSSSSSNSSNSSFSSSSNSSSKSSSDKNHHNHHSNYKNYDKCKKYEDNYYDKLRYIVINILLLAVIIFIVFNKGYGRVSLFRRIYNTLFITS